MRQETRFKFNAYLSQLAKLNGISVDDISKNSPSSRPLRKP